MGEIIANSSKVVNQSLQAYFYEMVADVVRKNNHNISENVSYYLVNLLDIHSKTDQIQTIEGKKPEELPLAIIFSKALNAELAERIRLFKILGDESLYVSGLFSDSLNKVAVDVDYYINMGGNAYSQLSELVVFTQNGRQFSPIYRELGEKFTQLVDILNEISDKCFIASNMNLLKVYEKWLKTGSQRAEDQLKNHGILPLNQVPDYIQ